jgi:hypothetical protein
MYDIKCKKNWISSLSVRPVKESKNDSCTLLTSLRIKEQTVTDEDENYRLRTASDGGMNSDIL